MSTSTSEWALAAGERDVEGAPLREFIGQIVQYFGDPLLRGRGTRRDFLDRPSHHVVTIRLVGVC